MSNGCFPSKVGTWVTIIDVYGMSEFDVEDAINARLEWLHKTASVDGFRVRVTDINIDVNTACILYNLSYKNK